MPFKNKRKYNKFQKKSYNRKRRNYKNRQQLLSIKTVKAIAKKACQELPETKFKVFKNYDGVGVSNRVIQQPTNVFSYHEVIVDTTDLPKGTGQGERIGESIFLKGFRLNAIVKGPKQLNTSRTSAEGGMSQYLEFFIKIIRINSDAQESAELIPPDNDLNVPDNLYINMRDLNLGGRERVIQTIYTKKIVMKPKIINFTTGTDIQQCNPLIYKIDDYIKINKKIHYTGTADGDWKSNYLIWVYCYNNNHYIPVGKQYWNDDTNYCPRLDHAITAYYTDS